MKTLAPTGAQSSCQYSRTPKNSSQRSQISADVLRSQSLIPAKMRPSRVKVVPCAPIFVCASRPAEEGQVAARLPSQAMAIESMVAGRWLRRFSRRCRFRPSVHSAASIRQIHSRVSGCWLHQRRLIFREQLDYARSLNSRV